MVINYRKLWAVLGVACLSANLTAAPASSSSTSSSPSQMDSTDQNMMESGLMYAGPKLGEDSAGISLGADYILWQVVQEGLETTISNVIDPSAGSSAQLGSTSFPKFKFLNGFKVHGGVTIPNCDDVDLFLQYIWLQRTTGTNSGTGGTTTYVALPVDILFPNILDNKYVNSWSSSFETSYNVLDFEMGRLSSFSKKSLSIRPFLGIRGVWNTHTWTPQIIADVYDIIDTLLPNFIISYQSTSGAGVRAGANLLWKFFADSEYFGSLKIIGMSALSGVYGRTYVDQQNGTIFQTGTVRGYYNRSSLNRLFPIVDLSIGLSWDKNFGGEKGSDYNVEIHALWDTQSWIGYGRHLTSYFVSRGPQNLTVQGFTIGAQLMF
jgi:hypothetical protein